MSAARPELPAVARRRVRMALRAARERAGSSQTDVAKSLGWSLSKVQRIELGEVSISPTDLRAILTHYRLGDEERIAELMADARVARRERYWTVPEHRDHLPSGLLQLLQFELAATTIREFQPSLVPGYLQTPEYARAALLLLGHELSEDQFRVRHEVRLTRRDRVIRGAAAPEYRVLLDESVLWRLVGDLGVMIGQFEDLVEFASRPNVQLRVLPMDDGALMNMTGAFMVVNLGPDADDAVLYRETYLRDELVEDSPDVADHLQVFERFWRGSLDEEATRAVILARAYDLRAKAARTGSTVPE